MIRLTDVLTDIVTGNPFLQFGLQQRLLNLTQTAKYLRPIIQEGTKKSVTESAVLMALSRMQSEMSAKAPQRTQYQIDRIGMQTGLSTFTYRSTDEAHADVHKLYNAIQKQGGYITITEGTQQITIIVAEVYIPLVRKYIRQKTQFKHEYISSISVTFDEKYAAIPGFIYVIIQQLTLMNVNIIEVSSTFTELALYIADDDVKFAFDALHALFSAKD